MDMLCGGESKRVHDLEGKARGNADTGRKRSRCKESYLMEKLII